jgi:hypothetical protein
MNLPSAPSPAAPDEPSRAVAPEALRGPVRWLLLAGAWALLGVVGVDLFFRFSDGGLDPNFLFTADNLYLPALYRDLFEEGGRWAGWRLTPAPYFFPDMPLYFLLDAVTGPFVHAILAYAAVQLALWVLAAQLLVRATLPKEAVAVGQVLAVAVVVTVLLVFSQGRFLPARYALLSAFHFSVVLLGMVGLVFALRTFEGGSRAAPWLLGAVCCLMTASDRLFIFAFTVPAGVCFALLAWMRRPVPWRRLGVMVAVLSVGTLAGFRLARRLTRRRLDAAYTELGVDQALESLRQLGGVLVGQFQSSPGLGLLWVGTMVGALSVVVLRRKQWTAPDSPRWRLYAVCLFTVLAVGANMGVVVATGLFADPDSFRYLLLPVLFPLFGVCCAGLWVPRERWQRLLGAGGLGLVAVWGGWLMAHHPWRTEGPWISQFSPPVVRCLDENQARYGLARGVSDYWNAKSVTMFSRTGLRTNQLVHEGRTYHWINNIDWYLDRRGPRPEYNFVIAEGLDMEAFQRQYGSPRETFRCGELVEIHVYGEDFDATLRAALADQVNPPKR